MKHKQIYKMVLAAMFLAIAQVLPLITGNIPTIGKMLCPMHIPVLLCGFICGWPWGLAVGFIAPLLRGLIFGMPVFFPDGVGMAFELATYGFTAGILYNQVFKRKKIFLYPTLFITMIDGRLVWGLVRFIIAGIFNLNFGIGIFWTKGFVNAVPGIILQIVVVPALVVAIEGIEKRAGVYES